MAGNLLTIRPSGRAPAAATVAATKARLDFSQDIEKRRARNGKHHRCSSPRSRMGWRKASRDTSHPVNQYEEETMATGTGGGTAGNYMCM